MQTGRSLFMEMNLFDKRFGSSDRWRWRCWESIADMEVSRWMWE